MKIELVKQILDRIYYAKEVVFKGNPEILEVKVVFFNSTARGVVLRVGGLPPPPGSSSPTSRKYFNHIFVNKDDILSTVFWVSLYKHRDGLFFLF